MTPSPAAVLVKFEGWCYLNTYGIIESMSGTFNVKKLDVQEVED